MPELPEVEIVCRNLTEIIQPPRKISQWHFWRKDLRFDLPKKALHKLEGETVLSIKRRAKYILFELRDFFVISHLGMTGQWKEFQGVCADYERQKHDHVGLQMAKDLFLIYEDPRRFGFIEVVPRDQLLEYFSTLGPEPLDEHVDLALLTDVFRSKNATVKQILMDQRFLVGVGNIYASEALFRARINPFQVASKVSKAKYEKLWGEVRVILSAAIEHGGSTIKNYRNAKNEAGQFQTQFLVYDREDQVCPNCVKHKISRELISGRATFWCKACQRS